MKKLISASLIGILLSTSLYAADDCYVGFKIKNGVFKQKLRNSTEKRLGLENWKGDQFRPELLTFEAAPEYSRRGHYEKCEIKNLKYAGERFSGLGTALKKGAVGTALFTAGIGTLALTIASLYFQEESRQNNLMSVEKDNFEKSTQKATTIVYVNTYDHLYPGYTVYVHDRRHYRTTHVHYHFHYMSAYEYHRLRTMQLGAIAATLLIAEAFRVPKNMKSTNLKGPAEKMIGEADCNEQAIKEKLMFDSYLFCGDFKSSAVSSFYNKNVVALETLREFLIALKRGKFKKAEKMLIDSRLHNLAEVRADLGTVTTGQVSVGEALDGKSPLESVQRRKANIGSREVELVCDQTWAYDKKDLERVGNDFIPLNRYDSCKIRL